MKALNKVEIKNTFRISAASAIEAATISVTESHMNISGVVSIDGGTFVSKRTIKSTTIDYTSVYNEAIFVEHVSGNQYRVEVGSIKLDEHEWLHLTGGDDAVNEVGFYADKDQQSVLGAEEPVISAEEYEKQLAHWIDNDIKENTPNRMESYIKGKYSKVTMVNGVFK